MAESPSYEENLALVAQANAAGPPRVRSACPACGRRNVVDVRQVMRLQRPGTFSLAGVQAKHPAGSCGVYECPACQADGDAEPK